MNTKFCNFTDLRSGLKGHFSQTEIKFFSGSKETPFVTDIVNKFSFRPKRNFHITRALKAELHSSRERHDQSDL